MSLRFQKRIQILPWVWLNISKSGFSFSFGPPGLSVNLGKKGVKTTIGIPGTGLSASHLFEVGKKSPATENQIEPYSSGYPNEKPAPHMDEGDPLYARAVSFVIETRRASISAVQRYLKIGYDRAALLIEQMELDGVVSEMTPAGSREVLRDGSSKLIRANPLLNVGPGQARHFQMAENDGYAVDPEVAELLADRTFSQEQVDQVLDDVAFAAWMENFLDEENIAADSLYSRAVVYALTRKHIHPSRLAYELMIMPERAFHLVDLMGREGIRRESEDSYRAISPFDIDELRKDFEAFRAYAPDN